MHRNPDRFLEWGKAPRKYFTVLHITLTLTITITIAITITITVAITITLTISITITFTNYLCSYSFV